MSRNQSLNGRRERLFSRVVLIGTMAACAAWYVLSGVRSFEALLVPGLVSAATVGSVFGFGRARTRARWKAAWDAYAAREASRAPVRPYQEEGLLSMAGTH